MKDLFAHLTQAQQDAVRHVEGPLLILAGPGSGKTRVVTHRVAHLLSQGVPARQILALTFTNKAADEMRGRVHALVPGATVWMSTFHRFAARILRQYAGLVGLGENFTIYDTSDSRRALARTIEDLRLGAIHYTPERIASAISWAKNRMILPEEFQPRGGSPVDNLVAQLYPEYQKRLLASSAVDFDDLLLHLATLLRDNPEVRAELDERFRFVMVDEYQDTNLVQYAIVRGMSIDAPNLAVTGDPDQAIYGWRGANLRNILDFEADFAGAKVVRLEQNYRSTKSILRVADQLIVHNFQRKQKGLFTDNAEGARVRLVIYPTQADEAEGIAARINADVRAGKRRPRDFAVFYRTNALSRSMESAMHDHGIPYQIVHGVEFFQRAEIKDMLAYLHLINNPRDDVAFLRVVNTPARGIGARTLSHLREYAQRYNQTLLEAARESGLIESISKRTAAKIAAFVALYDRLRLKAAAPVEEILGHVLNETGYKTQFDVESEEDADRLANIQELLTDARQYDEQHPHDGSLEGYLERASLVNDTDDWETENDKVTMMTLHAAKGLEFPVVYIIAVEDGLLPHERSRDNAEQFEEERRLLFVGITRAEEELQLSLVKQRDFRGVRRSVVPSSFLVELPRSEMECVEVRYQQSFAATFDPDAGDSGMGDGDSGMGDIDAGDTSFDPDTFADDADWDVDVAHAKPEIKPAKAKPKRTAAAIKLTTAAELGQLDAAERPAPPAISPDDFYQGMMVMHPEYHLGKVIALSGNGPRRTATVAFATAGQRKFIIERSQLRPVK